MVPKHQALTALNMDPFSFRAIAERLGIDPDQELFSDHDIMLVRFEGGKEQTPKLQPGITAEEAAEILDVTIGSFRSYWAPKVTRIRRGVYDRASVEAVASGRNGEQPQIEPPQLLPKKQEIRVQRIMVDETETGTAVTLFVEGERDAVLKKIIEAIA